MNHSMDPPLPGNATAGAGARDYLPGVGAWRPVSAGYDWYGPLDPEGLNDRDDPFAGTPPSHAPRAVERPGHRPAPPAGAGREPRREAAPGASRVRAAEAR